jgi:diaminopropionate ammonia-lyase
MANVSQRATCVIQTCDKGRRNEWRTRAGFVKRLILQRGELMIDFHNLYANPRVTKSVCAGSLGLTTTECEAAYEEIASWPNYAPTPLVNLSGLARAFGIGSILYKDEGNRFGLGSFKALGGAYAVFRLLQTTVSKQIGTAPSSAELRSGKFRDLTEAVTVATATDGNHGRSVAWGSRLFHCQSVVYVPRACSRSRERAISDYGARVVRCDGGYDETVRQSICEAEQHDWFVVSDTSWDGYEDAPAVTMQGYTVMTREIFDQVGSITPTHTFVQGGCGGLAAAVGTHFCELWGVHRPRFIVVEPSGAACLYTSAIAGEPTPAPGEVRTMMAGLDCGHVSRLAWRFLVKGTDFFMTVSDSVVPQCMKLLAVSPYGDPAIVAGESAVAGLAGLLSILDDPGARAELRLDAKSSVLLFGTEADTDANLYQDLTGMSAQEVLGRTLLK